MWRLLELPPKSRQKFVAGNSEGHSPKNQCFIWKSREEVYLCNPVKYRKVPEAYVKPLSQFGCVGYKTSPNGKKNRR